MVESIDVIIPVYNEEKGIRSFYDRIRQIPLNLNLIFIDNASEDDSLSILESLPDVSIIRHSKNEGYGSSICDGIQQSSGDIIVIIDVDCEYPPEYIPDLIDSLDDSDVVYASRFLEKSQVRMPILKTFGNKLITGLFNRLFDQKLTDLYTGFKVLKRSALEGIKLEKKGFEHVLEMGVEFSRRQRRITEVFVPFSPRSTDQSKMKHVGETAKYLYLIFYYYLTGKK